MHAPASKWNVVVERLALHRVLEAVDAGLDDAVDLFGCAVVERRHQAELGQHLGEERRAALIACVSMSVLSIMPLFLLAMAAPALRQRSEQKAKVG